jgi:hypothetical protein
MSTGISVKSGWLLTAISCDPTINVEARYLSAGMLLRILAHSATESKTIDLHIAANHIPPNISLF